MEKAQKYDKVSVIEAIEYVIPKRDLCTEAIERGWSSSMSETASVFLYDFLSKMVRILARPYFTDALVQLQKRVRTRLNASSVRGPWGLPGSAEPVNIADAFTLMPIDDIPLEMRFSYETSDGRIYAFSAPELWWYISSSKVAMNPFTREHLPMEAQNRLAKITKKMNRPNIEWRTPKDAFTDVLYGFECMGFYSRLEWFSELNGDCLLYTSPSPRD